MDFKVLQYLLKSCVLDSVGVIVVIDDLKVTNCLPWAWCCKMHFRLSLASSLCVDGEVGWSAHLHSWNTRVYLSVLSVCIKSRCFCDIKWFNSVFGGKCNVLGNLYLTCLVKSGTLCSHLASIMGRIHFYFERTDRNFLMKPVKGDN